MITQVESPPVAAEEGLAVRRTGYPVFEILIIALPVLAILIWLAVQALGAFFR